MGSTQSTWGFAISSSTLASNKATQQTQPSLFRTTQDEDFSSRRCSGCHSLCSAAPWRDGKKSWGGHWKGGWKNGHEEKCTDGPFEFTSTYSVVATLDQVVDSNNNPTGGLAGAKGLYEYGINSKEDYICWNIVLENFRGDYQSPADTATHIHEAPKGKSGPP